MRSLSFADVASLAVPLLGNLSLVWLFAEALLFPLAHVEFVLRTSVAMGFIEFLSAHSSAMLAGGRRQRGGVALPWRLYLVVLYGLFAAMLGATFDNFLLPLLFVVSLVSKVFGRTAKSETLPVTVFYLVLVIGTLGVAVPLAEALERFAPLPAELAARFGDASGSLRAPRLFLVWGTLYYSFAAVLEAVVWVWEDEVRRWAPWLRRR